MVDFTLEKPETQAPTLSEVSERDIKWTEVKRASSLLSDLFRLEGRDKYSTRVKQCASTLHFLHSTGDDTQKDNFRLYRGDFCRVRLCPTCGWRRALMWRARFYVALGEMLRDYPKHRWISLVLTVKNPPLSELRDTIAAMNKGFVALSRMKEFPAIGWFKALEVTRSDEDEAHPHFHCILLVNSSYFTHGYLSHERWGEMWQKAMKLDYHPQVWVAPADRPRKKRGRQSKQVQPDVVEALDTEADGAERTREVIMTSVVEAVKYNAKPQDYLGQDLPDLQRLVKAGKRRTLAQWVSELSDQLHNTRSINVGGVFKNYFKTEEPEDLVHAEQQISAMEKKHGTHIYFGWKEQQNVYRMNDAIEGVLPPEKYKKTNNQEP